MFGRSALLFSAVILSLVVVTSGATQRTSRAEKAPPPYKIKIPPLPPAVPIDDIDKIKNTGNRHYE
jgi:hypothetical protein